jgi:predicted acyltransferase (DUF342 family)
MKKFYTVFIFFIVIIFASCKKDTQTLNDVEPQQSAVTSQAPATGSSQRMPRWMRNTTIFAVESVHVGERNIIKGDVHVSGASGRIEINKDSKLFGMVEAAEMIIDNSSSVPNQLLSAYEGPMPEMKYYAANKTEGSLMIPEGSTIDVNENHASVIIGKGAKVTLYGSDYGVIQANGACEITFVQPVVNVRAFITSNSSTSENVQVQFLAESELRIQKQLSLEGNILFNEDAALKVTVYLGDAASEKGQCTIQGGNCTFVADIVGHQSLLIVKDNIAGKNTMTGCFVAGTIVSGKNTTWQRSASAE